MNGVGFSLSIVSLGLTLALSGTAVSAQTTPDTGAPIQAAAATVTFSQAELDQILGLDFSEHFGQRTLLLAFDSGAIAWQGSPLSTLT